jgi:hypothetical protein
VRPKAWLRATALAVAAAMALPLQAMADGPDHGGGASALCAALGQVSAQTLTVLEGIPSLAALLQQCAGQGGEQGDQGEGGSTNPLCTALTSLPQDQVSALQGDSAISALLQGCQGGAGTGTGSSGEAFDDLGGYGWAGPAIAQLARLNILRGIGHGRFDPGGTLTRAQFAALVTRLFNLQPPASGATTFVDVSSGDWAYSAIAAAAPYMSQYRTPGGTAFEPDLPVTRIDVAATIGELEVAEGATQLPSASAAAAVWAGFADGGQVPAGIAQAAAVAVQLGFMKGYPDGSFGVEHPVSRAEAAVLLARVLASGETMVAGGPLQPGAPTVTSISPAAGAAGATVTITGTGFTGGATVSFGGTAATSVDVLSLTEITAVAPAGTGTVDVTVTTSAGTSAKTAGDRFTYCASQTVSGSVYCSGT